MFRFSPSFYRNAAGHPTSPPAPAAAVPPTAEPKAASVEGIADALLKPVGERTTHAKTDIVPPLRSAGVRCVYAPTVMTLAATAATTLGKTILTKTDGSAATSWEYIKNPSARAVYGAAYDGTALTSGTTEISVTAGDVIEVAGIADSKVVSVGYHTVVTADIGTGA